MSQKSSHRTITRLKWTSEVVRYETNPNRGGSDRMPGANMKAALSKEVNFVIYKIIVVIAVPEITRLLLALIRKPSLDAHCQTGLRLTALMPQLQSLGT